MSRQLRVFGWTGYDSRVGGAHSQARHIVAATSMAECARLAGERHPRNLFNLCETGNDYEIREAMKEPGVIFTRSINDYSPKPMLLRGIKP